MKRRRSNFLLIRSNGSLLEKERKKERLFFYSGWSSVQLEDRGSCAPTTYAVRNGIYKTCHAATLSISSQEAPDSADEGLRKWSAHRSDKHIRNLFSSSSSFRRHRPLQWAEKQIFLDDGKIETFFCNPTSNFLFNRNCVRQEEDEEEEEEEAIFYNNIQTRSRVRKIVFPYKNKNKKRRCHDTKRNSNQCF